MLEPAVTKIGMPMEEFIRLYDTEGPFELIDGERIPVMPTPAGHSKVTKRLFLALELLAQAQNLGEAFTETTFALTDEPNWVEGSRVPDVMFFTAERLSAYIAATPDWELKPYTLVPDLVVEIVSPNDNLRELDEKVDRYLLDGVRAVWVVDPQRKKVLIHTLNSRSPFTKQITTLQIGDTLTGGDIIPGFEMPVAKIFE